MQIATLVRVLDQPHAAAEHLHAWGLRDASRGHEALRALSEIGLPLEVLAALCRQIGEYLPAQPDPDAALAGLQQFFVASRSPLELATLIERDASALPMLLGALSLSSAWQALLVHDPEAFDLLRQGNGQPLSRSAMLSMAEEEVAAAADERSLIAALRRVYQRHALRIAYGEVVLRHKSELVAEQLTLLADSLIAAALAAAERRVGQTGRLAVVALGRLGGGEMDYGRTLDLLLLYDPPPAPTDAARRVVHELCERTMRLLVKYLGDEGKGEPIYEIRAMPLPDSLSPHIAHTADDAVLGLDSFGRTWHRQAMLRARPIAGDRELAAGVLDRLQSWVFRRYLNRADETGIGALRRRIVRRTATAETRLPDVQHSRGGLADIEASVEFLQLLVGVEHAAVRKPGTLAAIAGLEQAGIISVDERTLLEASYLWLMQLLHRLQIARGPEISALPADEPSLAPIASSLGLGDSGQLQREVQSRLERTWGVLTRLLEPPPSEESPPAVVDLLLAPDPTPEEAAAALAGYGLADPQAAAANLHRLAQERVAFLSTRRCRHFLSLIVERLLAAIAVTPHPDATLANLVRVSDSLGGKGALWELLHFHPPSLLLYVRLCAASPYLSDILTANPGMLDDLVDSLQLDRLPTQGELEFKFAQLVRGGNDPLPILHHLKNASHLRIGVRDILGQDPIEATHASLAEVAEFCLARLIDREYEALVQKHGQPLCGPARQPGSPAEGRPCRLVVLGLGKLGGREPNYHSSLEVAFLYEADGFTQPAPRTRQQRTANNHFFNQLAQRVIKEASQLTPQGRLFPVESPLRSISGGSLVQPLADFQAYFQSGAAPLLHWQALCQARPVFGEADIQAAAAAVVRQLLIGRAWQGEEPRELLRARRDQEHGAAELNLKRGRGGTLDSEWLAQLLQIRHAAASPQVLAAGTQPALAALASAGALDPDDAQYFIESYRLLRRIESALRLMNTPARHDLPEDPVKLARLALLVGQPNGDTLRDRTIMTLAENRRRFERIVNELR